MLTRTRPSPIDIVIALAGGLAATYALTLPNGGLRVRRVLASIGCGISRISPKVIVIIDSVVNKQRKKGRDIAHNPPQLN